VIVDRRGAHVATGAVLAVEFVLVD